MMSPSREMIPLVTRHDYDIFGHQRPMLSLAVKENVSIQHAQRRSRIPYAQDINCCIILPQVLDIVWREIFVDEETPPHALVLLPT